MRWVDGFLPFAIPFPLSTIPALRGNVGLSLAKQYGTSVRVIAAH